MIRIPRRAAFVLLLAAVALAAGCSSAPEPQPEKRTAPAQDPSEAVKNAEEAFEWQDRVLEGKAPIEEDDKKSSDDKDKKEGDKKKPGAAEDAGNPDEGGAENRAQRRAISRDRPAWVDGKGRAPSVPADRYMVGLGRARLTGDLVKDMDAAEGDARAAIAEQFEIQVTQVFKSLKEETAAGSGANRRAFYRHDVSVDVKTVASMNIRDSRIVDRYVDRGAGVVYALAALNRGRFAQASAQRMRDEHTAAKTRAEKAGELAKTGKPLKAVGLLAAARDKLLRARLEGARLAIAAPPGFAAPTPEIKLSEIEKRIMDLSGDLVVLVTGRVKIDGVPDDSEALESRVVSALRGRGFSVRLAPESIHKRSARALRSLTPDELRRDAAGAGDYLLALSIKAQHSSTSRYGGVSSYFYHSSYDYRLWNTRTGELLAEDARAVDKKRTKYGHPQKRTAAVKSVELAAKELATLVQQGIEAQVQPAG